MNIMVRVGILFSPMAMAPVTGTIADRKIKWALDNFAYSMMVFITFIIGKKDGIGENKSTDDYLTFCDFS
jgi:hypothetical protein